MEKREKIELSKARMDRAKEFLKAAVDNADMEKHAISAYLDISYNA